METKAKSGYKRWAWIAAAVLGIVLVAVGVFRGEGNTVLQQAINICLECIGIG